jgi:trimethylamine--corrinoid protein Co-methyltransferase
MIEAKVRFRILSDEQIDRIHAAAMRVLGETGCEVRHERGVEILKRAGAQVDETRVRIGADLVEEAIRRAPRKIVLGDRNGAEVMELAGDQVYFGTGSDCLYVLDGETHRRGKALLADTRQFARLADRLDEIDFIMSMACASDVPPERLYREQFAAMLLESSKPIVFTVVDPGELGAILEMSIAAQGGLEAHLAAPHLLLYAEPISPLTHPQTSVEKLLFCGERRVPVTYSPGSMGGGTTPVTGAGSIVQSVAEILSGLVLHQFAYAGAPFVFGGSTGPMDMGTMVNIYSAPFGATWGAGLVEMGKRYGLPTWSTGGCSDSKIVDGQAAIDSSLMTLSAALNGANLVHDVGYLESGMTSSLEMLVISAEIIAIVGRMTGGLGTSDEDLAVEAIDRVGPGGNFLMDEHTLNNFRREMFAPALLDYQSFPAWEAGGATSLLDRARTRIRDLLDSPPRSPIQESTRQNVLEILNR